MGCLAAVWSATFTGANKTDHNAPPGEEKWITLCGSTIDNWHEINCLFTIPGRQYYVDHINRSTTWERPPPVPKLPNEIWLEIMSYLSTYDVLRNMACVSKKFHQLSKDRCLIRKIQLDFESWPENKKVEYINQGIRKVIKRSHNLTFVSFDFAENTSGLSLFVWALRILNRYCPKLKIIKLDFMLVM